MFPIYWKDFYVIIDKDHRLGSVQEGNFIALRPAPYEDVIQRKF